MWIINIIKIVKNEFTIKNRLGINITDDIYFVITEIYYELNVVSFVSQLLHRFYNFNKSIKCTHVEKKLVFISLSQWINSS